MALSASRARVVATGLLVLLTAVWGSTFFLIRDLVETVPPTDFLAVRFSIAAVLMLVIFWPHVRRLRRHEWVVGLGLGVVYGVAQLLQTIGLAHTDASVSGFITGTYVVLTPVFSALLLRERVPPSTWAAVALATVGLGRALAGAAGCRFGLGETLTLACAAVYALHIIGLGRWSTPSHATGLAAVPDDRDRGRQRRVGPAGRRSRCRRGPASGRRCSTWRPPPGSSRCGSRRGRRPG